MVIYTYICIYYFSKFAILLSVKICILGTKTVEWISFVFLTNSSCQLAVLALETVFYEILNICESWLIIDQIIDWLTKIDYLFNINIHLYSFYIQIYSFYFIIYFNSIASGDNGLDLEVRDR